ncbi:glycosyltransferase [Hahella aquimaris]|uniref:glycosyltransferase n=1 Tax=Hahella sp. HNIBRBA332 TaxID=3015983 RepID=UPI00273C5EEB|nr:glycosyltransferase [Hahella sp. HNIBRBA332]WLQ15813.1 glycosyltransferase [Hahella sp. HNIBRBA332]
MNIVMVTNTYLPHVGGVARSVESFTREYRRRGHKVLVIAPEFPNQPQEEEGVIRVPAIQNFNGSDFSMVLPVPGLLGEALDAFQPDIVHSHHPYLLGMTALRVARYRETPLVFTHHTLYEEYTHYVPADRPLFKRFVVELATIYANMTDRVFAPSDSVARLIRERGVRMPISVVPTGVKLQDFQRGEGGLFRHSVGISQEAYVIGHVGRLAPEKNLKFLAEAVAAFMLLNRYAHFLVVGEGPSEAEMRDVFHRYGLADRLHFAGQLQLPHLADAYHAMDVFAFSSQSETQGMVLTEAMAAGVPVAALDGAGVREVVIDQENGYLIKEPSIVEFIGALQHFGAQSRVERRRMQECARLTAESFSLSATAEAALRHYESLQRLAHISEPETEEQWERVLNLIKAEWNIVKGMAGAAGAAIVGGGVSSQECEQDRG